MRVEVKAKWVEALRSGEYNQGTGALGNSDGQFCCLGVLCELAVEEGAIQRGVKPNGEKSYGINVEGDPYMGSTSYLPGQVATWAGLRDFYGNPDQNPRVAGGHTLSNLNDEGKTFAEIADLIEANF